MISPFSADIAVIVRDIERLSRVYQIPVWNIMAAIHGQIRLIDDTAGCQTSLSEYIKEAL